MHTEIFACAFFSVSKHYASLTNFDNFVLCPNGRLKFISFEVESFFAAQIALNMWKRCILWTWTVFKVIVRHLPWALVEGAWRSLARSLLLIYVVISNSALDRNRDIRKTVQVTKILYPFHWHSIYELNVLSCVCVFSFHSNRVHTFQSI